MVPSSLVLGVQLLPSDDLVPADGWGNEGDGRGTRELGVGCSLRRLGHDGPEGKLNIMMTVSAGMLPALVLSCQG